MTFKIIDGVYVVLNIIMVNIGEKNLTEILRLALLVNRKFIRVVFHF